MAIRAVVFEIGSVLEIIDDSLFPGPLESRLGLRPGEFSAVTDKMPGDPTLGEVTEAQMRAHWQSAFRLDDEQAEQMMREFWAWYTGTLDERLYNWFAELRPDVKAALLSNSAPGAREAEALWGFEEVADCIVYSHEVGLAKPDPRIFRLTQDRLGVRPPEIVFLDDVEPFVDAARAEGWHGVVHTSAEESITALEEVIRTAARG